MLGEYEAAYQIAKESMQHFPLAKDHADGPIIHNFAVHIIALAGYRDEALQLIKTMLNTPGGFKRWELQLDPRWDFFRDDERFNQLIKPANFDQSMHANKEQQNP